MPHEPSIWNFIANASWVVKLVIFILMSLSVASWTLVVQRITLLRHFREKTHRFERKFWSGVNLVELHETQQRQRASLQGLACVFYAGFEEFSRLNKRPGITPHAILDGCQRAMHIAITQEMQLLEEHLSFLATVGSISPYIGLLGTVWGIMGSFRSLGSVQQATISMVAPGISEALIATAIGLFAAIPAVIAYNRFNNDVEALHQRFELFADELLNILHRQIYTTAPSTPTLSAAHATPEASNATTTIPQEIFG